MIKDFLGYIAVAAVAVLAIFSFAHQPDKPVDPVPATKKVIEKDSLQVYQLPSLRIPDNVTFAGERVPVDDPDIRERLDRELHVNTFWHSNTIILIKRAHRWLPQIEQVLVKNGVPSDFKYMPVIESDLQNKISPSNAVGYWQMLRGTAREYGLTVNREVDERYHPIKSTEAASQYLKKAYNKFGSWTDAAASYNIGMRGLQRSMEFQQVDSYYDLLLNDETSRYVLRIIAVKMIFENPEQYGFRLDEDQLYHQEDVREVKVEQTIPDLRKFAFEQGINYKVLKRHNPWLRDDRLTVRRNESYMILIPEQ